jgi:aspartate oxidase
LAAAYQFSEFTLLKDIETHNSFWDKQAKGDKVKDDFGKTVFPVKFNTNNPIYIAQVTPAIHFTMGGLKIDRNVILS